MTYQEKMKWLGRYQAALSYQHMLEDEIEVLRSDAERVTTCMSGMPGRGGPNVDRLPRAVERIEKALEDGVNLTQETTLSGVIARHVFYTVDNGKDSFNCEAVICSRDYYSMYIITLTASVDTYESHTEDFKNIISSFSFK